MFISSALYDGGYGRAGRFLWVDKDEPEEVMCYACDDPENPDASCRLFFIIWNEMGYSYDENDYWRYDDRILEWLAEGGRNCEYVDFDELMARIAFTEMPQE